MFGRSSYCNCITLNTNFKRTHFKRQYFHEHLMRMLCVNVKAIEIVISTLSFSFYLSLSASCNETEYLFESAINLLFLGRMSLCFLRCVKMVLSTSRCRSTISALILKMYTWVLYIYIYVCFVNIWNGKHF